MLNFFEKGYTDTSSCFMCVHKVSPKNNFFCGPCKKDKIVSQNAVYKHWNLSFLRRQNEKTFFYKTLCRAHTFANMYAWNFLLIILTFKNMFKMHFSKSGRICPWDQDVPTQQVYDEMLQLNFIFKQILLPLTEISTPIIVISGC